MDRDIFFTHVRATVYSGGAISMTAFAAIDEILRQGRGLPGAHLAYMMTTAYHEAGADMVPRRENLTYTTASRIRQVWPSRFPTNASAQPYVRQPKKLANLVYGDRLGNKKADDGWDYRGAGLAQITGYMNFAKFGIASTPDKALELPTAVMILIRGLTEGLFTGKKLSDYKLPASFKAARAIVNGDVAANGEKIAITARQFLAAFEAAGYTTNSTTTDPDLDTPEVTEPVVEQPVVDAPPGEWKPTLSVPEYLDIIETSVAAVRKLLAEK